MPAVPFIFGDRMTRSKFGAQTKFRAVKTEVDGIVFHSKKEAKQYEDLKLLERIGTVKNIELQPKFPIVLNGQKICTYIADFRYFDQELGVRIVDVKGMKTPIYRLKKKLVEAQYGIEIQEV
jgi:hypothetical protein